MHLRQSGIAIVVAAAWVVLAVSTRAEDVALKHDADAMKQKLSAMAAAGEKPPKGAYRTTVTESEVNAYLALEAGAQLPAGVVEPSVSIVGGGRVSGKATVDLDAVRKAGPKTGLLDPRSYMTGQLPVTATGTLRASDGVGRFEFESAKVGRIPIPKAFLQEIVTYYSKSPERPTGVGLDDAFMLPVGIREIQIARGQAVIVQ